MFKNGLLTPFRSFAVLIIFTLMVFSNYLTIHNISNLLSVFSNIVTILGAYGIYRVWIDYKNSQKEIKDKQNNETLQAIRALKFQLELMKDWTGYKGNGYTDTAENIEKWSKSAFITRANPFSFVIPIESSPLKQIHLQPGIKYFNSDIIEAITKVNQLLSAYVTLLKEIRRFKYGWGTTNLLKLAEKLENNKTSELSIEETLFTDRLMKFQIKLHFNIVGDNKNGGLHYWHKKLYNSLNGLELECLSNKAILPKK